MLQQLETGIALDFVLWVQSFQAVFLDTLAQILDAAGSNLAYVFILPLIYWSINRQMARRLLFVLVVTGLLTVSMKIGFARPRPSTAHPDLVRQMFETASYAFPSGHVAIAAALWVYAALWVRRLWFSVFVALYILLMSWSRIYSGTHYPHDVIMGAIVGTGSAFGVRYGMPGLAHFWTNHVPKPVEIVLIIAIGIGAAFASQGEVTGVAAAGAAIGAALGLTLEESFVQFRTHGTLMKRIARFTLGLILTGLIFFGLMQVLESNKWFNILQYSITILFALGIYPWIAVKLGLADRAEKRVEHDSVILQDIT